MKKLLPIFITVLFLNGVIVTPVFSQEMPAGVDGDFVKQFEQEFGGTPTDFLPPTQAIEKPTFEEPGNVPDSVKQYVSESDLVEVYCATLRWKSGKFFSAIDATKKHIVPAVEKVKALDIAVELPNFDTLKAAGFSRVEMICRAQNLAEAQSGVNDFFNWGQKEVVGELNDLQKTLEQKITAKGDEYRNKIKADIDVFVSSERVRIEGELKNEATTLSETKKAELEKSGSMNVDVEAVKRQISQQMASRAAAEQSKLEATIERKIDEIMGGKKEMFEEVGSLFKDIEKRISSDVDSSLGQYDQYKKEAIELRKKLVLDILDKNIASGMKQLDEAKQDIDEARKDDPSVKTSGEIMAEIEKDKKTLTAKLDVALASDDENAFQAALNEFRTKWESYRTTMERVATQSVSRVCTIALTQFDQARSRISSGALQIRDLKNRCADKATDECLKINEFAPRLGVLESKMTDIEKQMTLAEGICRSSEVSDRKNLIALMKKIQSDAEEVRVYGESLEVEKSKAIAASAKQVCAQVLPQLNAGKVEIEKNELASLEIELAKCKVTKTGICASTKISSQVNGIKTLVKDFSTEVSKVENFCSNATEDQFIELKDNLDYLRSIGEKIKTDAKALRVEADIYKKPTMKEICKSASANFETMRQEVSRNLVEMNSLTAGCQSSLDQRCTAINKSAETLASIRSNSEALLVKITGVTTECQKAGSDQASDDFVNRLNSIKSDGEALRKLAAGVKGEVDLTWVNYIKSGKGFKVVFDVSPSKFNDSVWTGDWRTDQMGTIRGGDTYTLTYGTSGWGATGYNEGVKKVGTWTYRNGTPERFELNVWGRVYKFDGAGNVYDPDFGLVGHLVK